MQNRKSSLIKLLTLFSLFIFLSGNAVKVNASQLPVSQNVTSLGSRIYAPSVLYVGEVLKSPSGQYEVTLLSNGELVEYNASGGLLWSSGYNANVANSSSDRLALQTDGNLVVYNQFNVPVWNSGTFNTGTNNYLSLQDDGNLVLYNSFNYPLWADWVLWDNVPSSVLTVGSELTAGNCLYYPNGENNDTFSLCMQTDGNLVLYVSGTHIVGDINYNLNKQPIWSAGTYGTGSDDHLVMQTDGNLVVYTSSGQPVWNSGTYGTGNLNHLSLQSNGDLSIVASSSHLVWTNNIHDVSSTLFAGETLLAGQSIENSNYRLTMQTDGNLVVYRNANGASAWSSGTYGTGNDNRLVMQADNNLVMYTSNNVAVWSSGTYHASSTMAVLTNLGEFITVNYAGNTVFGLGFLSHPYIIANVPHLYQTNSSEYCEAASLTMALQYEGINVSIADVIAHENVQYPSNVYPLNGQWVSNGDPYNSFVGNPYGTGTTTSSYGYGTYYPNIAIDATSFGGKVLFEGVGLSMQQLLLYVMAGHPVEVWVVDNNSCSIQPRSPLFYVQAADGSIVPYPLYNNEHVVLVTGASLGGIYIQNPLPCSGGSSQGWIPMNLFASSFSTFNDMAVVFN